MSGHCSQPTVPALATAARNSVLSTAPEPAEGHPSNHAEQAESHHAEAAKRHADGASSAEPHRHRQAHRPAVSTRLAQRGPAQTHAQHKRTVPAAAPSVSIARKTSRKCARHTSRIVRTSDAIAPFTSPAAFWARPSCTLPALRRERQAPTRRSTHARKRVGARARVSAARAHAHGVCQRMVRLAAMDNRYLLGLRCSLWRA